MTIVVPALRAAVAPAPWVKNELWRNAREVPTLDQRFADDKSLIDAISGQQLITHTRASAGTYRGSDGLIRTAVTNLLLRSEELATSPWFNANVTITNNSTDVLDPVGGSTSTKIVATGSSSAVGQGATISSASTGSIWLRTSTGTANFKLIFYLANSPFTNIGTANITVTTTWQRFSVTSSAPPSAATYNLQLQTIPATTLYAWGAQLEQSSTVGEYVPTTSTINSAPRFDHDPTTGESLGLLVEESRTNLLEDSENFSSWGGFRKSVTSDQALSPAGLLNADLAAAIESNNSGAAILQQFTPSTTTYTFSVFVKANTTSALLLRPQNTGTFSEAAEAYFNLSTGQNGGVSDDGLVFTNSSQQIKDCGNGWYKCSVTFTLASASFTGHARIYIIDSVGSSSVTSGASFYIWGAQLEEGSFPTSYIPTTTATVTRAADVASIEGANFSSWYRQDEGTVFAKASTSLSASAHVLIGMSTGSFAGSVYTTKNGSNELGVAPAAAPSDVNILLGPIPANTSFNHGFAFTADTGGSASAVLNGGTVGVDSTTGIPVSMDRCGIGCAPWSIGTTLWNGHIRRLTYWPQRLPNEVLQTITL